MLDLERVLGLSDAPVLLLEGIRALPEADRASVVAMGRMLAQSLPHVRFRSGNAEGTDTAFAEGVTSVDPARMEYVMTHAGMGRKRRHPDSRALSLDDIPYVAEGPVSEYTVAASPSTRGLVEIFRARGRTGPLGSKVAYLLRDTAKVIGAPEAGLAPATAAIFYVNTDDPLAGGTGHTIRVCFDRNVPAIFQMT